MGSGERGGLSQPEKPASTVWAIKLPDGRLVAKILGETRPTRKNGLLRDGEKLAGGPYPDIKTAIFASRADLYRAHLLRGIIDQGIFVANPRNGIHGRYKPTLEDVAEWSGYSVRTIKSWLQPANSHTRRGMPLPAIRHIVLEFAFRDESAYAWQKALRKCR